MQKALVVLSGGQDSTTSLFLAKQKYQEVHAITFDYGQRHRIEIEAAIKIAGMAEVASHEVVAVPNCLASASPLTSRNPLERYQSIEQMDAVISNRRELTFVPMRNALFLTIAANRAEALGAKHIVTGVCGMDYANYDDCRQTFITATEQYINTALGHDHRGTGWMYIDTPLMNLDKGQSVALAYHTKGAWEALAHSHTCYDGKYAPCGTCHSCMLRAHGFEQACRPDPLILRAYREGLLSLPKTSNYQGV